MKAALCKSLDGPEGLAIEEVAEPLPGSGEVVVKVKAAALNFFDTLITRGKYQAKPELPFSPSAEVAGVVEALGTGVRGVKVGDRVMAYLGWGGAREKVVAKADALIAIPEGVSDAVAAGVSVTYGTAIHGLKDRGQPQGRRDGGGARRGGRRRVGGGGDRQADGRARHRRCLLAGKARGLLASTAPTKQ